MRSKGRLIRVLSEKNSPAEVYDLGHCTTLTVDLYSAMTDAQSTQVKKKKIYCNRCEQTTNHSLVGEHRALDSDETGWWDSFTYRLWVCAGCEAGTMEEEYSDVSMVDYEGNEISQFDLYPKRMREDLTPKKFLKLKPKLTQIYSESITCFNSGSLLLCTAGLRALLEGVCDDKRIRGKNLRDKIDNLQPLLANKNIVKNLHHFRFTGNQAVHDLESPTKSDTKLAVEVMEDLLNFLYELDYKAARLRSAAKERKRKERMKKAAKSAGVPSNPFRSTQKQTPEQSSNS